MTDIVEVLNQAIAREAALADEPSNIEDWHVSIMVAEAREAAAALKLAKMLCDNINEFGQVIDCELYDAAEKAIRAALEDPTHAK